MFDCDPDSVRSSNMSRVSVILQARLRHFKVITATLLCDASKHGSQRLRRCHVCSFQQHIVEYSALKCRVRSKDRGGDKFQMLRQHRHATIGMCRANRKPMQFICVRATTLLVCCDIYTHVSHLQPEDSAVIQRMIHVTGHGKLHAIITVFRKVCVRACRDHHIG